MTALPGILFAIFLMSVINSGAFKRIFVGSQVINVVIVIGITSWVATLPVDARADPELREQEYVTAARSIGRDRVPRWPCRHLLPNAIPPLIIAITLAIPAAIFAEAGLSFLGIGINEPVPSLGKMVADSRQYIQLYWHLGLFPSLAIALGRAGIRFLGRWSAGCTRPAPDITRGRPSTERPQAKGRVHQVNEKNSLSEVLDQFPKDDPLSVSRRRFIAAGAAAMATGIPGHQRRCGPAPAVARIGHRARGRVRRRLMPRRPRSRSSSFRTDVGDRPRCSTSTSRSTNARSLPTSSASRWSASNRNFEIIPASRSPGKGSEDGKTWTFKLRQGLTWSDGNPLTAADWVATFQYAANPEHAWDFTWFFRGVIKGWNDAVAGKAGVDTVGVAQGASEYELVITHGWCRPRTFRR